MAPPINATRSTAGERRKKETDEKKRKRKSKSNVGFRRRQNQLGELVMFGTAFFLAVALQGSSAFLSPVNPRAAQTFGLRGSKWRASCCKGFQLSKDVGPTRWVKQKHMSKSFVPYLTFFSLFSRRLAPNARMFALARKELNDYVRRRAPLRIISIIFVVCCGARGMMFDGV